MSQRRRVLVLAYFFPPLGGAGVQRTLKFVKYLPAHGWDPIVVTTDSRAYPVSDESLAEEVPAGTPVIRAHERMAARRAVQRLERIPVPHITAPFTWPDEMIGWLPAAAKAASAAIRTHRPDALFTTSSPYSAHLAGLAASRTSGIPWVADFRDEWSLNPYNRRPWPLSAADRSAERAVLRRADAVVRAVDYFRFVEPAWNERAITIPNGIDPADAPALASWHRGDRFRLAYVGTLYGPRNAAPVLDALAQLVRERAVGDGEIEFRGVGNLWSRPTAPPGVHMVETGYVPHADAIAEMEAADALLLYEPPGSLAMTGKVFEYLATGRPILCVAPPANRAGQLVEELGAGVVVRPDDVEGIRAAIVELHASWRRGDLESRADVREIVLERFSRERLAAQLAGVLEAAAVRSASTATQ